MTVQPFCVDTTDLAEEEVIEVLERAVANGADLYEYVFGMESDRNNVYSYEWDAHQFWGVDGVNNTLIEDDTSGFDNNILTLQEVRNLYPCDKYDNQKEESIEWELKAGENAVVTIDKKDYDVYIVGISEDGTEAIVEVTADMFQDNFYQQYAYIGRPIECFKPPKTNQFKQSLHEKFNGDLDKHSDALYDMFNELKGECL